MSRVLKKTRIKGLPPKNQLRYKDSLAASYPIGDGYVSSFDDERTVIFKSYGSVAATGNPQYGGSEGFSPNFDFPIENYSSLHLLAWYPMQSDQVVTGNFTSYSAGTVIDMGGFGSTAPDLLIPNDAVYGPFSDSNTDVQYFDGTTYRNNKSDKIFAKTSDISNPTHLESPPTTAYEMYNDEAFTVSFHVNPKNTISFFQPLVHKGDSPYSDWQIYLTPDFAVELGVFKRSNGFHAVWTTPNEAVPRNELGFPTDTLIWSHIVGTFFIDYGNGNALVPQIYVNGVNQSLSLVINTGFNAFTFNANAKLLVAKLDDDDYFADVIRSDIYMQQLTIFDRVITAAEVEVLRTGIVSLTGDPQGSTIINGLNLGSGLPSGSMFLTSEITADINTIGVLRKGVGDAWIDPLIETFTPFRDSWQPAVDAISAYSASNTIQNPFYATGSKVVDVGEGFDQPLWSKTKIEIDLTTRVETQFGIQNAFNPGTEGHYQMVYYNFDRGAWEGRGTGRADYDTGLTPEESIGLLTSDYHIGFAPSMGIPITSSIIDNIDYGVAPLLQAGYPISQYGFPHNAKYAGTSSNLYPLSGVIKEPFLCEKMVFEFTGAFKAGSIVVQFGPDLYDPYTNNFYPYYQGTTQNPGDFTIPTASFAVTNFFILNQRRPTKLNFELHQGLGDYDYYKVGFNPNFLTTSSIPTTVNGNYVNSIRDLVTFVGISSRGNEMSENIHGYTPDSIFNRDLNFPITEGTILNPARPGFPNLNWEGRYVISASLVSPSKTPVISSIVVYSPFVNVDAIDLGNLPYEIDTYFNGGRQGLDIAGISGRDHLSPISNFPRNSETLLSAGYIGGLLHFFAGGTNGTRAKGNRDAFQKRNPYLLLPSDNLIFGWQVPAMLNQTMNVNSGSLGPNLTFPVGECRLVLYGSYVRAGKEFHEVANITLSAPGVHEAIE